MDSIQDIDTYLSVMNFGHENPLKILDIGAHEGRFTAAIKERYPTAKSFMFEPSPEQFAIIGERFQNDFVFNYGVTDTRKKSKFVLYGGTLSQLNRVTEAEQVEEGNQLIEMQMVSLDSIRGTILNGLNIDICKIDTEGQELNVLKGASEMLKAKAISYIIFEAGSTWTALGYTFKEVVTLLNSFGYSVYSFAWDNKPFEITPEHNDYSLCDYLATYKPVL